MPGTINIPKIFYGNPTAVVQTWQFEFKLPDEPESAYVLLGNSTVAPATGDLNTPINQTGLPSGTLYYVRATNMSCSPGEIYVQQYTTT